MENWIDAFLAVISLALAVLSSSGIGRKLEEAGAFDTVMSVCIKGAAIIAAGKFLVIPESVNLTSKYMGRLVLPHR